MVSQKQREANRNNALLSTGPRTAEGKAIVSQNALKHGLLSREVVLQDESKEQFGGFCERLMADLAPAGELEYMLADRIVAAAWRLGRAGRIEREMMEADVSNGRDEAFGHSGRRETLGACFSLDMIKHDSYGKFTRYEAHIERALYKALHEFQRLQTARQGQLVAAPVAVDPDVTVASGGG